MPPFLTIAAMAVWLHQGPRSDQARIQVVRPVASAPVVQVTLVVTDNDGRGVNGLARQDFSVLDAGARQEVADFHPGPPGNKTPYGADAVLSHVLIVLAPMDFEPRARAIAETRRLLRALQGRSDVEVQVIDGPRLVQAATRDTAAAERAVDQNMAPLRNPGPNDAMETSWLSTTKSGLQGMAVQAGPKSMVYFVEADLHDSGRLLVPLAVQADVAIYPIVLRDMPPAGPLGAASDEASVATNTGEPALDPGARASSSLSESSYQLGRLGRVAEATGGLLVTKSVVSILEQIAGSGTGLYVLGYRLSPEMADGRFHSVRVSVNRAGVTVHSEQGYFAPEVP
jgi:VWFA-related protein